MSERTPRLTYRHTRYAAYLGYVTQAIINNLPPLLFIYFQEYFGVSYERLGRLVLLNFMTQIVVDVIAVRYADRIGYRKLARLAHVLAAFGLLLLAAAPRISGRPYGAIALAMIVTAIGGGLIEVLITPLVDALPGDSKAGSIAFLHSFYCWGHMAVIILSTLLLFVIGGQLWWILPLLWALLPLANSFFFGLVPVIEPSEQPARFRLRTLLRSRWFMLTMVLMLAAGAGEQVIAQWSSLFAQQGLGVPKVWGDLLGPALFALGMGLGRLYYGLNSERLKLARVIFLSALILIGGYLITVFSPWPVLSFLGTALCGLGVSIMWPGSSALAGERFPGGGTPLFGTLSIMGDVGCALGPWLSGAVSDSVVSNPDAAELAGRWNMGIDELGLKTGIFLGIGFAILLAAGSFIFLRHPAVRDETPDRR